MDKITEIEPQKRRNKRRSIYINGEFFAGVDQEVVIDLGLKVGQVVDSDKLAEVLRTEELRKTREAALTLLDYRARTRKELETRLLQKGYPEDVIAKVLEQLEGVDLVNDERFANDWVAGRLEHRPTGKTRMSWELRRKGVNPETVDEALEQVDEDKEFEMALALAKRKLGNAEVRDPETRNKLAGFLQRRGFYWEIVSRVINRLSPED